MAASGKNPAAVALGKLGGKAKSAAKAHASRANGKLGGRPPKEWFATGDGGGHWVDPKRSRSKKAKEVAL